MRDPTDALFSFIFLFAFFFFKTSSRYAIQAELELTVQAKLI